MTIHVVTVNIASINITKMGSLITAIVRTVRITFLANASIFFNDCFFESSNIAHL